MSASPTTTVSSPDDPPSPASFTSPDSRFGERGRADEATLAADGLLDPALLSTAEARIRGVLPPTPVLASERLGAALKLESLQATGAYKVRGAFNALAARVGRGDYRPVFAASAGNHGLGVAWAARRLGLAATVVVPADAPATKIAGCRALGATLVQATGGFEACAVVARRLAAAAGGHFLHAFDDAEVIAGQSTVAAELLSLDPDVVVVPVGGGGLLAGMGSLLRRHGIRVVGVQVAGVDSLRRALSGEGAPGSGSPPAATLADGLRVAAPGRLPLRIASAFLDEIVVVSEEEVTAALVGLAVHERIVAEGAGAVAVAALTRVRGNRRVAVVSGGNIDPRVLGNLIVSATSSGARGAL